LRKLELITSKGGVSNLKFNFKLNVSEFKSNFIRRCKFEIFYN
jgi:hypothetical protein